MYSNHCSETGQAAWNKCDNGKKTQDPTVHIDIVLGSQFANLCMPFFNAENEIFIFCELFLFSVNLQTERKFSPDNARTVTKMTKTGHFGRLRIWGP